MSASCMSCCGEGVLASEVGPQPCPDCAGEGTSPARPQLVEHRLGDIDRRLGRPGGRAQIDQADVRWLLHELRCSREALVRILSRSLDAGPTDPLAIEVRYVANLALGYYEPGES